MNLSTLVEFIHGASGMEGAKKITGYGKSQVFGFVDKKEHVSFMAVDYSIEMVVPAMNPSNGAAALLFDDFRNRVTLEGMSIGDRYMDRHAHCVAAHTAIIKAGYVITQCVRHLHSDGDMVRMEYYKAPNETDLVGSSLRVIYTPTDYMPEGAIVIETKHGERDSQVYYTVNYEEGQLTYLSAAEFDGRPNRTIEISKIEDKVWKGKAMHLRYNAQLIGIDVKEVTSLTHSETQRGWKREYTALLYTGETVEIVVTNYHCHS